MWTTHSEELPNRRGLRFVIHLDTSPVSFSEVLSRSKGNARERNSGLQRRLMFSFRNSRAWFSAIDIVTATRIRS